MLHNALTSYPKLLAAFRRALGETSQDFSGIERAGETLTPTVNLWSLPEWALLRGEVIYSRFMVAPAGGAGTFASIELVNPATSGMLAVVLEIGVINGVADVGVDSGTAIGAGTVSRGVANDCRWPNLGAVSLCTLTLGTPAAGVSLPQDVVASATRSVRPYVIQPGKKLAIIAETANAAHYYSLLWTERPLLSGESGI